MKSGKIIDNLTVLIIMGLTILFMVSCEDNINDDNDYYNGSEDDNTSYPVGSYSGETTEGGDCVFRDASNSKVNGLFLSDFFDFT